MKSLKYFLIVLLIGSWPAHAEPPPVCGGTDLLAKLQHDDPAKFAAVLAKAEAVPNGEAVFWRIERDGLEPSFLLGTAHVTDPKVTELSPAARDGLAGARTVALELKELRDQKELAMASLRQARLMVLPAGQSLWDLIPDADEPAIRGNANLPPGAANTLYGYQPWVVAAMLTVPLCEIARKQAGAATLDEVIATEAMRQGSALVGLETIEEQLSVLSGMPLELQAKYLVEAAKLGPKTADYLATLVSLYEQRRIPAYVPLMQLLEPADRDGEAMMAFIEQDLTAKRNLVMMRRAAEILAKGDAFIAVGALHLPGEQGLVELIRQSGYKVTAVN